MEYAKDLGDKSLKLEWKTDKMDRSLIPTSQLYSNNAITSLDDDLKNKSYYKIYPVPAGDFLNIGNQNSYRALFREFFIYNSLGSLVFKQKAEEVGHQQWQLNVSGLPAGIYYIRQNENSLVLKFVKK
jgi:hypothetical protein